MGKRNAAAAIVDADRLQQFETPPKRMKHGPTPNSVSLAAAPPVVEPYSPNISVSEFTLSKEFVDGTRLMDLTLKQWRIGKPIGKGSFGEIFLASDDIDTPVTSENAKYVVKIEPHSNGPLFVEIHCLLNTAKRTETCIIPPGMPEYIASGSHMFKNERYRFLILKRYQRDLHSLIKNKRVNPTSIPVIACQILDVLEHLHDQGYVHSDIKAENLMIGMVEGDGNAATTRLSNGQHNGNDHHRSNGVALPPEGKGGRGRGKKASAEFPTVNGSGAATTAQENGLYYHQEQEMCTRTRNLRPLKTVTYRDLSDEDERSGVARAKGGGLLQKRRGRKRNNDASFSCSISPRRSGYEELKAATEEAHRNELKRTSLPKTEDQLSTEERIHLIDFGLASKFVDSTGQHRPFCMDQRRAHDGTLEFTSRDAHMGAHARRSDLECLGFNLVYWSRGFLPWKDEKLLNQPEQVHRMKEYFMADVREMLRLIYGDDCPAYLGEFLAYVGNLTYDERPDYQYCKSLFYKELKRLGSPLSRHQPLRLDVNAIVQLSDPLTAQDEAEITNKINHVKSLMKMGALIPYRESMLHSKASSPKNLRSKRGDANGRNAQAATTVTDGASATHPSAGTPNVASAISTRKKEKQFSCEEIFATDADQIARERAEKEFERAEQMEEIVIRYSGKPTYAIQELLERKSRGHSLGSGLEYTETEGYIKGYTKPMMDILRKRQSQLFRQIEELNSAGKNKETACDSGTDAPMEQQECEGEDEEEAEEQEDDEEEEEEDNEEEGDVEEEVEAVQVNELEDEDEDDVKLPKYEQDDDYEQAAEDDDDSVDDDDEEEEVASEEEEAEEEYVEEEDEEDELEEDDEDEEEETVIQNGYESRGSYRRKKESKSRKKEDTDSDFINDGGCEEEGAETDACNLPAVEEEEEEEENDEDDQQDSDFNDQESTATESDVIVPVKRGVGRPRKQTSLRTDTESDSRIVRKRGRPRKSSIKSEATLSHDIHDNEDEASDCSRKGAIAVSKQRSGHRRKRQQVLDDGDGDNARLFGDQDGREAVRKQTHHPYNNNNHCNSKAYYGDVDDSSHDMAPPSGAGEGHDKNASKYRFVKRRKSGLRERIRPTDRGNDYADNMQRKRRAAMQNKQRRESAAMLGDMEGVDSEAVPSVIEDDYSCSSSTSTSPSVSSSCTSNRSSRAISHSSSAASLVSSSSIVAPQKRRGRKRKHPPVVSSRESSGTRQSSAQCGSSVPSRRQVTVMDNETGNANNRWGRSNSNSSQSAATSRSSSVSASANGVSGGSEYAAHHQQLATVPEHQDDFLEEDDGDDTRDVDYSPVCTRRRRKATAGTEAGGNGTVSRKHGSTTIRKKHDSKGLVGKGIGTAPPQPLPPSSSSSSSSSSGSTANGGTGTNLPPVYGQSSIARRLVNIIQPAPPAPVAAAALIQHHHHQQQQPQQHQRGRRPQHHLAYQNYYRVNDQHHLPSTMLVRTYSRG